MNDTPRTDAEAVLFGRLMLTPNEPTGKADWRPFESTELVPAGFARQLERELADAIASRNYALKSARIEDEAHDLTIKRLAGELCPMCGGSLKNFFKKA